MRNIVKKVMIVIIVLFYFELTVYAEDIKNTNNLIKEAKKIIQMRNEVGDKLLKILKDKNKNPNLRISCAKILSEINYIPAIKTMVEYIDLYDPEHIITESSIENTYPLVGILRTYGFASVPYVVTGYIEEKNKVKKDLLLFVFLSDKIKRKAIIYVVGYLETCNEENKKEKIRKLLKLLKQSSK